MHSVNYGKATVAAYFGLGFVAALVLVGLAREVLPTEPTVGIGSPGAVIGEAGDVAGRYDPATQSYSVTPEEHFEVLNSIDQLSDHLLSRVAAGGEFEQRLYEIGEDLYLTPEQILARLSLLLVEVDRADGSSHNAQRQPAQGPPADPGEPLL